MNFQIRWTSKSWWEKDRSSKYGWKPIDLYLDKDEDDLLPMLALKGEEEQEESIIERVKLNLWKRKREGAQLKILTPNKLLIRLPILLVQIKARNNSYKFKKSNQTNTALFALAWSNY